MTQMMEMGHSHPYIVFSGQRLSVPACQVDQKTFIVYRQNVMLLENGDATAGRPLKGKGIFNFGTLWRQTNMKQEIRTIQQYFGIGKKIINSGEMQHGSKQGEGGFWGKTQREGEENRGK